MSALQHLPGFLPSAIRLVVLLLMYAVVFVPLEWLFAVRPGQILRKSVFGDLGFYFLNALLPQFLLAVPLGLAAYVAYHFVPWRVHAEIAAWPLWLRALVAFVVGDLGFYWGHRWAHQIPYLWRFHSVHHDPEHVYFLISARAHPIDFVFIHMSGLIPIYLLGLGSPASVRSALLPTLIMLVASTWGFFIHANVRWRLGPLEWLIATPAFHHWHHTLAEPRDRNYASMLPWWDRLFGTHYLPKHWPTAYGIENKLPASLLGQLLHPIFGPNGPPPATVPEPRPGVPQVSANASSSG